MSLKSPDVKFVKTLTRGSMKQVIGDGDSEEDMLLNSGERSKFLSMLWKAKTIMDIEKFEDFQDKSSIKTSELSGKLQVRKFNSQSDSQESSFESHSLSSSDESARRRMVTTKAGK